MQANSPDEAAQSAEGGGEPPAVRVAIVDDEAPGRANLRMALAPFTGWQIVAECDSALSALSLLERQAVDVVFIDVQMPVQSGLDLARLLCAMPDPPLLVFVTAHSHYAIDAFDVHALDYLLKPLDDERLAQTLRRAEALLGLQQRSGYAAAVRACMEDAADSEAGRHLPFLRRFSVRSVGKLEVIDLADVDWVASAGNYVELQVGSRSVLHRIPLSRLEPRLDPAEFLRTHRTAIVRREQLRELQVVSDGSYLAKLRCGACVPVSLRHVAAVREQMSRGVA